MNDYWYNLTNIQPFLWQDMTKKEDSERLDYKVESELFLIQTIKLNRIYKLWGIQYIITHM